MPAKVSLVKKCRAHIMLFLIDAEIYIIRYRLTIMAIVAQLVRALVCGTRGRRFESGLSPHPLKLNCNLC